MVRWLVLVSALATLALAGCDHTPTGSWSLPDRQPLTSGNPRLLTYNPGWDTKPVWLPDGSGFYYTLERAGQDPDRCLGLMPSSGGGLREEICDRSLGGADSLTTLESAAAASDGRLAYVWSASEQNDVAPVRREIRLATRVRPTPGARLLALPYIAPSGKPHLTAAALHWVSPGTLAYLGMRVVYHTPCQFCPIDTLQAGEDVVLFDVAGGGRTLVPGTEQATSFAMAGGDTVYYTLPQDSRVLRRIVSSGTVTVAHDFGPPAIARDVAVAGSRLVAVVGGRTRLVTPEPGAPPMQIDDGGDVWVVDLGSGAATPLGAPPFRWFKSVALSPDGRRLVAEGYIVDSSSTVGRPGDLWLFDLP